MNIVPLFPNTLTVDLVEENTDELKEHDESFYGTEYGSGSKASKDISCLLYTSPSPRD